ncbi:hypothetical protein IHE45_19G167600 [Dioscorea alata]|uniref:Uncharacterized protein n=1 Tax=Dioscorea alata TaxID=55571 RepID=A0ACB7U3G4_DIOAL|nr:hypothetical protein IHE45_19G167600 [Dioscorea alata]
MQARPRPDLVWVSCGFEDDVAMNFLEEKKLVLNHRYLS